MTSVPGMTARDLRQHMDEIAARDRAEEQKRRRPSAFTVATALGAALLGIPGLLFLVLMLSFIEDGDLDGPATLGAGPAVIAGIFATLFGALLALASILSARKKRST